ncbi:hypothetical protein BS47DRAFT_1459789 [Hydnum rufescens UP504]|uniref:Protein kinase domain-containing protein n=1 Tax=Hydnum rufescens UP504 TaxID=1448309 RepID=A0A9P6AXE2_9AGAM|nr:hypothetical protein BS47DRAFT_1459789 [Hydnum rufescens UP504]
MGLIFLLLHLTLYFDAGVWLIRQASYYFSIPSGIPRSTNLVHLAFVAYGARASGVWLGRFTSWGGRSAVFARLPAGGTASSELDCLGEVKNDQESPSEIPPSLLSSLPRTLLDWRNTDVYPPRKVWDPLQAWFATRGLHLFKADDPNSAFFGAVFPTDPTIRAPDGNYIYTGNPESCLFQFTRCQKPIHCFAQTVDGRYVLIRLIAKGDFGHEELDILQKVAMGPLSFLGENHCLPMAQQLTLQDMTFGVFPAVTEGFGFPWYHAISEVFDATIQLLEALNFLHRHLIAHRDIGADNILINFVGGKRPITPDLPFRSLFPVRYYFIDFELAVRFAETSPVEDRVVTGLPIKRLGSDDPDDYGRDIAPEMLSDAPYNPFQTDVFQMGIMFYNYFRLLKEDAPGLVAIFERMAAAEPNARPTAGEALDMVRACEKTLTRAQLALPVPEASLPDRNYTERLKRKVAKAKAKSEALVAFQNAI